MSFTIVGTLYNVVLYSTTFEYLLNDAQQCFVQTMFTKQLRLFGKKTSLKEIIEYTQP